jgi:multiple sugar transport system permease protein
MATQVASSASGIFPRAAGVSNRRWALYASYFFLFLFIIFFMFPPYYMLITSFKTNEEISSLAGNPWIFNMAPTLEHYSHLLFNTSFLTFFKNTVIVTVSTVAISMVVSILAAYSLARMRFLGSATIATGVFLTYLVPETLLLFTVAWAQFLYPLAFLYSEDQLTLTVGTVTTLIRGDVYHWGGLMAGALLAAAPPVIVYAFLMDYYIAGLTSGATKS